MRSILSILFIASVALVTAQNDPFNLVIEPLDIEEVGGIQSYAFGQHEGKWLIVGGRLDGLHRRQPFAAFDLAGHNNQLHVIDPVAKQHWTASLSSLPTSLQEQLSSTNMEFIQEGNYLYCLGGYGYSATEADHTTYPMLTAIDVPEVINAIINGSSFSNHFRQISDSKFQVTGGKLKKIYDTYYLLGGQKFIGRYNPMGPTHGPGFFQEYTNAIRRFKIEDDGINLNITHLSEWVDSSKLHRRDYNAESQILPTGAQTITMFSGVFQPDVDLPFLDAINLDSLGFYPAFDFQQYYNHYHCPVLPLYSASNFEMHTVFFGGIAQYYDDNGTLVQDNNVPFVNTIARVTRASNSDMAEFKLPVEMPSLLGAGAEFIPIDTLPRYSNGVFKLDELVGDSVLVGYIYGGISSSAANIFFINDGTQSEAASQIFKVYLIDDNSLSSHELNDASKSGLNFQVYPNPSAGDLSLSFRLKQSTDVAITIQDVNGRILKTMRKTNLSQGEHIIDEELDGMPPASVYFITVEAGGEASTRRVIMKRSRHH